MRTTIGLISLVLTATLVATPVANGQGGFITLKDGSIVQGHLVSIDDMQLTGVIEPDGEERTFKREEMTPGSWYMCRSQTAGKDAKARMELARFCVANGLFGNAKTELEEVWDLDESMREEAKALWLKANEAGAANLLRVAESAFKKKNFKSAKRLASQILTEYSDTKAAERAGEIMDELQADEDATPTMAKQVHQPLTEAQVEKLSETDPRAIDAKKHLERARERNLDALKEKSMSAAQEKYEGAIHDFKMVLKIADKVLEEEKDEPVVVERVNEFKVTVRDETIETYINWAGLLAGRSSYNNADEVIKKCLVMFPDSQRARDYRKHIQTLKAMSSGERWGRWRR